MGSGKKIIAGLNEAIEHAKANTEQRNDAVRLKPCPFCGGEATLEKLENGQRSVGCIEASGQPCIGFQMLSSYPTDAEAIAAWNCRYPRSDDERSTMERLADILRDSSYKPTQRFLGAAFLGYDYARRLYSGQIALPDAQPPAPSPLEGEVREAIERSRATAMEYAVKARIPECGKFGEIAQDLDAALSDLSTEAGSGEARITKEWCLNMAALEDGEIGAGMPDHPLRTPATEGVAMTEDQIKHMAERFLGWKLPEDFHPDAGISFKPTFNDSPKVMEMLGITEPCRHEPVGTNLFSYEQALAMVRYLAEGLPMPQSAPLSHDAEGESATVSREGELRVALQRALLAELGDTYDCTRVWSAWSVGTMDQDDFRPVLDRLDELIDAIVHEIATPATSTERGR